MRRLARLGERMVVHLTEVRTETRKKSGELRDLIEKRLLYLPEAERENVLKRELTSSKQIIKAVRRYMSAEQRTAAALRDIAFKIRKLSDVAARLSIKRLEIISQAKAAAIDEVTEVLRQDLKAINVQEVLNQKPLETLTLKPTESVDNSESPISAEQVLEFLRGE